MENYQISRKDFPSDRELLAEVFAAARRRGTADTNLFGLRLQRGSFDFFIQQTDLLYANLKSDLERIEAAFGSTFFIYLSRKDKVDQAISRVKAEQTGLWHKAPNGDEIERLSEPREPTYSRNEITRHVAELTALEESWKAWFDRENVQPLEISYDVLSDDPQGILRKILLRLGLDASIASTIQLPTAKLADQSSRAWAAQYRAEMVSG